MTPERDEAQRQVQQQVDQLNVWIQKVYQQHRMWPMFTMHLEDGLPIVSIELWRSRALPVQTRAQRESPADVVDFPAKDGS